MAIDTVVREVVQTGPNIERIVPFGVVHIPKNGLYAIPTRDGIQPNAYVVDGKKVSFFAITNSVPGQGGLYQVDASRYGVNRCSKVRAVEPNSGRFMVTEESGLFSSVLYIDFV